MSYVLLDFDGIAIRWFSYPATGTIEIKKVKKSYSELLQEFGESLL